MFKKVSQRKLYEMVADQIEEGIIRGDFKPGDRLPSERKLQEMLGASRGTLREAFRVLEQKGLVEIRGGVGGGCFIKTLTFKQIQESLILLIQFHHISSEDLAEFRESLEGLGAVLATERATDEDIKELKEMLSKTKDFVREGSAGWEGFNLLELKMHSKLMRMTRNPLWGSVVYILTEGMSSYGEILARGDEHILEAYNDWCEIIEGLEKREPDRVASVIRSHIRRFKEYLGKRKGRDNQ